MTRLPITLLLALSLLLVAGKLLAEDDDRIDEQIAEMIRRADAGRIGATIQRLQDFGTRNACATDGAPTRGVNAARDWIAAQFSAISPRLQVRLDPFTHPSCPSAPTFNVVAWLPGKKNPDRVIVIGGHYDSRTIKVNDAVSDAPGANDSGAQTSVVLEVARLLAGGGGEEGDDDGPNYDDTLVFASFSGEEQGLIGSTALALNLGKYVTNASVVAMLNNDISGGDNTVNGPAQLSQFRLYSPGTPRERTSGAPDGTTDNTSPSRGLMRYVGTWGAAYVPSMQMVAKLREDRPGRGSDQSSFIRLGLPGVRFMETVECSPSHPDNSTPYPPPGYPANCLDFNTAHQHAPTDLAKFTTPSYTARIAQVMAATMASLARAPGAPQNVTVTGNSIQGVTVSWSPPAFGRVHEYAIAARSTSENLYRRHVRAKARETSRFVTARDLGLNPGDSFFISVASEDSREHESLFAYPEFRCDATACVVPPEALNVTASK